MYYYVKYTINDRSQGTNSTHTCTGSVFLLKPLFYTNMLSMKPHTLLILSIYLFTVTIGKLQPQIEKQIVARTLQNIYDTHFRNDQSYIALLIEHDPNGFSSRLYNYISVRGNSLTVVLSTEGQCNWENLEKVTRLI